MRSFFAVHKKVTTVKHCNQFVFHSFNICGVAISLLLKQCACSEISRDALSCSQDNVLTARRSKTIRLSARQISRNNFILETVLVCFATFSQLHGLAMSTVRFTGYLKTQFELCWLHSSDQIGRWSWMFSRQQLQIIWS